MANVSVEIIENPVSVTTSDENITVDVTEEVTSISVATSGPQGPRGEQGIQGIQGIQGEAATIAVGDVTTSSPGSSASVTNVGTSADAVFNFVLPRGEQGPQGIPGEVQVSDLSYIHTQSVPSNTWTITHGLQFIPSITIVDSAGTVVEGSYNYPDANTVVATFSGAFSGKAYLS